jgi:mRNA interferase MazF
MIKRGAIYTMAARGSYTSKPRPAVILQNQALDLKSIIIVPLTTFDADAPNTRITIEPAPTNGLSIRSFAMCDKIAAVPVSNLDKEIGVLTREQLTDISAVIQFLLSDSDDLSA